MIQYDEIVYIMTTICTINYKNPLNSLWDRVYHCPNFIGEESDHKNKLRSYNQRGLGDVWSNTLILHENVKINNLMWTAQHWIDITELRLCF
jgi:hypothetical protein